MKTYFLSFLLCSASLSAAATPYPATPKPETAAQVARHEARLEHRAIQAERRDIRRDARYTTRGRLASLKELEPKHHRR